MYDLEYNDDFDLIINSEGDLEIIGSIEKEDVSEDVSEDTLELVERDLHFAIFIKQYEIIAQPTTEARIQFIKDIFKDDKRIKSFEIVTEDGTDFKIKDLKLN